jgi:peptide chain release factor 2
VQTFRAGGKGGQNQNARDTGVRVIHRPSGAVGESREERRQLQNKKRAFRRMGESAAFHRWALAHIDINAVEEACGSDIRIRTYNAIDNFVKDHRTGVKTSQVTEVLDGDLDLLR